jgi:hypothetical protein
MEIWGCQYFSVIGTSLETSTIAEVIGMVGDGRKIEKGTWKMESREAVSTSAGLIGRGIAVS